MEALPRFLPNYPPPVHILFQNQNQPQELKVKGLIFPLPHLIFG